MSVLQGVYKKHINVHKNKPKAVRGPELSLEPVTPNPQGLH